MTFRVAHDVEIGALVDRSTTPGEAFVVTTAPMTPQLEAILLRYMGMPQEGGLPSRIALDAKWYIGNELVAYSRKLADYDPLAFQGIYTCYVLVIIDEAGSVPKVDLRRGRCSGHQYRRLSRRGWKPR
jgi:hypothetical protein